MPVSRIALESKAFARHGHELRSFHLFLAMAAVVRKAAESS